jgi:fructose-1,6-bisphosphatase
MLGMICASLVTTVAVDTVVTSQPAQAVGSYSNAAIADAALAFGKGNYGGQCRAFVNQIINSVNGSEPTPYTNGGSYFQSFLNAGGVRITDSNALVKGDVVQKGEWDTSTGLHTWIIVGHISGNTFDVVDSNHLRDQKVDRYARTFMLSDTTRAYRMGTVVAAPSQPVVTDYDGDGVQDASDVLPSVPGTVGNRGVPVTSQRLTGDFNGDGKSDVAAFYAWSGNTTSLFTSYGDGTGNFAAPTATWNSGVGDWNYNNTKPVVADFNSDGKSDVAAFYNYGGGTTAIWLFTGAATGFNGPVMKWQSGVGDMEWSHVQPLAGDFNGDGKQDVAVFYDYAGGTSAIFTYFNNGNGGFAAPTATWNSGVGNWSWNSMKPVVADFNGDAKVDIAALYNYGGGTTSLWFFESAGTAFHNPTLKWESGIGDWEWFNTLQLGGDFNGDGKQDIVAFYDYYGGNTALFAFIGSGNGSFASPVSMWNSASGAWSWSATKPTSGDFNNDGRADIAALYNYGSGTTKLWFFESTGTAFHNPTLKWESGVGNWEWSNTMQF